MPSKRGAVREIAAGDRFRDDGDAGAGRDVALLELAAADQADADGGEIAGSDPVALERDAGIRPFDAKRARRRAVGDQPAGRDDRGCHAREPAHRGDQALAQRGRAVAGVAAGDRIERHRHEAIDLEPGIEPGEIDEACVRAARLRRPPRPTGPAAPRRAAACPSWRPGRRLALGRAQRHARGRRRSRAARGRGRTAPRSPATGRPRTASPARRPRRRPAIAATCRVPGGRGSCSPTRQPAAPPYRPPAPASRSR